MMTPYKLSTNHPKVQPYSYSRRIPGNTVNAPRGFALIATISVMVLLVMVALAMLSLSTITLRGQGHSRDQDVAQANARMALMLALGELQLQMGPDQRISAPASILDTGTDSEAIDGVANPGWIGVWNAKPQGSDLTYEEGRENSFRSWMVSLPGDDSFEDAQNMALSDADSVIIQGPDAGDQMIRAGLLDVQDGSGKFAWHVGDNALRARSNMPKENAEDIAGMIARRGGTARHTPQVVTGMADLSEDADDVRKLITDQTMPLALPALPTDQSWNNALTTRSVSLMTNVVDGGWRQDINTLFEQDNIGEFESLGFGKWEGSGAFGSEEAYLHGPRLALGARWNHLHTFYNLYKRVTFNSGVPEVQPKGQLINWLEADAGTNFGDEAGGFSFPRVAKIVYVFSYKSNKIAGSTPSRYELRLVTDIFVTLWNPYNTRIVFPTNCMMFIKFSEAIPMNFLWHINGVPQGSERSLFDLIRPHTISSRQGLFSQNRIYNPRNGNLFVMEPGEVTVFSAPGDTAGLGANSYASFISGVNHKFGTDVPVTLTNGGPTVTGEEGDLISVSLRASDGDDAFGGNAQYCDFWIQDGVRFDPSPGVRRFIHEHRGEIIAENDVPFISRMPSVEQDEVPEVTFGQVDSRDKKQPFGAFTVEIKTAADSNAPGMAFLHNGISRLSSRAGSNEGEWNTERMDYRLEPVTSFNGDLLQVTVPTHPAGPHHGFIGSGRTFGTGVTHVMHAGVPVLPMTSLAEFQHAGVGDGASALRATQWNSFNSTPLAPYMDYAVGNSYAHPLIASGSKRTGNYYDHSYHANEVLWDRYFCSSLAPQTQSIFNYKREMSEVWTEFLEEGKPMLNPRFRPYFGSREKEEVEEQVFNGSTLKKEAFRSIASNLLYEGGFNVNTTSVEAWKAFLSGARHDQLRILEAFQPIASAATETAEGTPFSRTKLPLAGSIDDGSSDRQRQYLGFRDLSDEQVTELARGIVEQVKKRGPFLSLADFVNRQLSSNAELAKSGALQAAIDASSVNSDIASTGVAVTGAGKGFNFPQAADGNSAAGSPGWLIQGDLLTPLGPSMFVRGDTFTIRAYGDARAANGDILARAYCEAVVQRLPDYVDGADDREVATPTQSVNQQFGRKFKIVQFRWINPSELN